MEDIQDLQLAFRRSGFGKLTESPWSFVGLSQPAEFNQDHRPSFLNGVLAKQFLCFYPHIRTAEWYLTFEANDLEVISQAIRHMRETQARRYTKYEWLFIVGRRFDLAEALAQYQ